MIWVFFLCQWVNKIRWVKAGGVVGDGLGVIIEKIFYCFISCFGPFAAFFFTLRAKLFPFVEFSIKIIFFFEPFPY